MARSSRTAPIDPANSRCTSAIASRRSAVAHSSVASRCDSRSRSSSARSAANFRKWFQIRLRRFFIQAGACHKGGQGEACGRAHQSHTRPTSISSNRICPCCCWHPARPSDLRSIVGPNPRGPDASAAGGRPSNGCGLGAIRNSCSNTRHETAKGRSAAGPAKGPPLQRTSGARVRDFGGAPSDRTCGASPEPCGFLLLAAKGSDDLGTIGTDTGASCPSGAVTVRAQCCIEHHSAPAPCEPSLHNATAARTLSRHAD